MTISVYLQCSAMFLLGQAVDLFFLKIPEYQALFKKANEDFSWKKYWRSDWYLIIGTQLVGAMLILGLNELVQWKPLILQYVKWFFGGVGLAGSALIVSKLSQCKKYIMGVIDFKTNKADGIAQSDN